MGPSTSARWDPRHRPAPGGTACPLHRRPGPVPDCNPDPAPDRGSDCNPGPRTAGVPTAHRRGPGGPGGAAPRRRRLPGAGSGPRRNSGGTHGRAGGEASAAAAGRSGRRRRMKSGQSPERSSRMARPRLLLPLPPLRSPPAAPRPAPLKRAAPGEAAAAQVPPRPAPESSSGPSVTPLGPSVLPCCRPGASSPLCCSSSNPARPARHRPGIPRSTRVFPISPCVFPCASGTSGRPRAPHYLRDNPTFRCPAGSPVPVTVPYRG